MRLLRAVCRLRGSFLSCPKIAFCGKVPPTGTQTASEHYLPLWGMKPTVLEQRNLLDLHTLILAH